MPRLVDALRGIIIPEKKQIAVRERVSAEFVREGVARGVIVILRKT